MDGNAQHFDEVILPSSSAGPLAQDEEWCEVVTAGQHRRIRFHDYAALYSIPGLYERLFYEELKCCSPQTVSGLLTDVLVRSGTDPAGLVCLDLGAGNGMVGETLVTLGVGAVVGIDILPEAAMATQRDRPGVYESYLVTDLTDLDAAERSKLSDRHFNLLTTVAALGFGDIPPAAFAAAYDLLIRDGWVALTLKEDFLAADDPSGFALLIRQMLESGHLEVQAQKTYQHRLSSQGNPLHYTAIVARKVGDASPDVVNAGSLT